MAEYPSIVLTNSGLEMIAESQIGQNLIFTKLKIGDGTLATGESISTLTGVKSPKLDVPIQGFTNQGNGQVRLRYLVDNTSVAVNQGFFAREVGIYAKMGESGTERLYAYTNGGNKVDWIPDKNTPLDAQIFDVFVLIGNASNVTVVINGSATYATRLDLTEHNDDGNAHSEVIAAHNTDDHAHAELLRLWQPSKNYVIGDTYRPLTLSYPSWIYLECIQGGGSGATEPVWPAVGQEITDGTAKWRVRDIKSSGGVTIGTITPRLALHPEPGELACDIGALVSRATYPDLWAWVQGNAPLITEVEWQAQAAIQSSVGFYSSGDGSTTFRLPRIVDFVSGATTSKPAGTFTPDTIQGHWHDVQAGAVSGGTKYTIQTGTQTAKTVVENSYTATGNYIANATAIVGDGVHGTPRIDSETKPKDVAMLYCVKAFDAPINQAMIDLTALANEVANLSASKLDKTAYQLKAWVNFSGIGTVSIRGSHNVSSITDNGVGDYTINFATPMPDANYCAQITLENASGFNSTDATHYIDYGGQTAGSLRIRGGNSESANYYDYPGVHVSVFR